MTTHNPEACPLCEVVPGEVYRRHWKHQPREGAWHSTSDGPDVMDRLPRAAHFLTVLSYRLIDDRPYYRGPLYFEYDAEDPADALHDLRRCVQVLHAQYGCPPEVLKIWQSGGRGYHVLLPPVLCGAEAGHPQLPRLYGEMVRRVFPVALARTLDRSVYSGGKGRMWRLPNRLRTDTKRYKVPVSVREILAQSSTDLDALTTQPRRGVFWATGNLQPCPGLVQLYREVVANPPPQRPTSPRLTPGASIPAGQRNVAMVRLAGAMRRQGAEADASSRRWWCITAAVLRPLRKRSCSASPLGRPHAMCHMTITLPSNLASAFEPSIRRRCDHGKNASS
jgi:hypothetical protein